MASTVLMPKAGISVESCIIGSWRKKPGDSVAAGDVLFDYETDKAAFECQSTVAGTLLEAFFQDGDEVPCLTAVCAMGEPGEDVSGLRPDADQAAPETTPAAPQAAASVTPQATTANAPVACVSPKARRMAENLGIDPEAASPTGPRGRIIARDVETLAQSLKTGTGIGGRSFGAAATPADVSAPVPQTAAEVQYTDEAFSKIRKTIAVSMHRSISETAQLTHHHTFDASEIMAYRAQCKAAADTLHTGGISLNDMVMYAVLRTLKTHPDLNTHLLEGGTLRRFHGVHLGMAVDTPRGLMVPTIFDADKLSLLALSKTAKELAAMAQVGNINPDLLQGGTFTVSNLGVLGVEMFTPILNPPQVAILGICGITARVRETSGGIETYPAMGLSLTYDHRAVDGAPAARFVQALSKNLARFSLLLAL